MSKSQSSTATRLIRAGVATAVVSAAVVVSTATAAQAVPIVLSAASGPTAGGNTVTGTATTNFLTGFTAPKAYFTQAVCPATWTTAALGSTVAPSASNTGVTPATVVKKLANNKVAVTVPSAVVVIGTAASSKYNLCVYGQATAGQALGANGAYSVAAPATITGITPAAGPPTGGNAVTVTGTGFPLTGITATLGGLPLTGIANMTSTSFTAVAPAHGAEADVTLSVTTASGTATLKAAYDYINGISIAPNTAPRTATSVDVDVIGSGFLDLNFASTAAVFLVNGKYNGATLSANRTNGPVVECLNVLVIADNELICNLNLTYSLNAAASFTPTASRTVTDGVTTLNSKNVTSATAAFTSADVDQPISGAGIPAGTTITSVTSATAAVMSADATASGTTISFTINGPIRTGVAVTATTLDSTAITASAATFTAADILRPIIGTGIQAGTVITAVTPTGNGATLSLPATATGASTAALHTPRAVPDDAYVLTVVSHKALDAATATATAALYEQTVVSSGSTFTVAPY